MNDFQISKEEGRQGWCFVLQEKLRLDPHKPLHEHWLFWLVVLIPILLGIALALPIWQAYSFSLSESGYETFLKISKLPFYVMAPAIPLGMVVAAFHKTKQTAEQIKQAESSNNFKNYVEHKKAFLEAAKDNRLLGKDETLALDIYNYFFPYAKAGNFSIKEVEVIQLVAQHFESYRVRNVLIDYHEGKLSKDPEYMKRRRLELLDGCIFLSKFFFDVGIPSTFIGRPEACAEHVEATNARDTRRALEVMGYENIFIKSFDEFRDLIVFVNQHCSDSGFRIPGIYFEKPDILKSEGGVDGKILALMTNGLISLNPRLAKNAFNYIVKAECLAIYDKLIFCNKRAWDEYDEVLETLEIQRTKLKQWTST